MSDNRLLEKSAVDAVRTAASKLGVDPLRFARFLQDGRIAEILGALGREHAMAAHRAEMGAMTQRYLDFLEEEVRLCKEELRGWTDPASADGV